MKHKVSTYELELIESGIIGNSYFEAMEAFTEVTKLNEVSHFLFHFINISYVGKM